MYIRLILKGDFEEKKILFWQARYLSKLFFFFFKITFQNKPIVHIDGTWSWYVGPGTTCALVSCLTRNVNSEKTVQSVMIDLFAGNSADVLQKSTQVITLHNKI